MSLIAYADRDALMAALAARLADDLRMAMGRRDRVTLCVPGGTTPGPIFDRLTETPLDWSRVDVLLNDERWVPEDHERSNTRLLRERLLVGKAADAGYLPLYAPADAPEDALDDLSGAIEARLPLDVVLLGMGADMHTASLFPGADQLDAALAEDAPVLLAMRAPGAPEPRITLSARVLNTAAARHIVITGEEKRAAYDRALVLSPAEAPVAAVLPGATVHWAP
ncbi:6-phosphogluconolactonase [Pseudaestuariivita atlantica]|uniref:6-phosphogluconolactonase n=1 Tax=Pseudaestuariivita atlantica TaxID=1317121 RepID=A0A0L1JMA6_9RHOB|nr:6-phosphogluconolactonase [Pseudaestuariivita atlantica]KNG92889.1 6-phosphogluconolactonase [Pseudaestuariivita atlantica]